MLIKRALMFLKSFNHPYNTWMTLNVDYDVHRDALFGEVYKECQETRAVPFSPELMQRLDVLSLKERQDIVSRGRDGYSPLFLACMRGSVKKVEYLIDVCGANIEQRGVYECLEDRSFHFVTPLWCAAVSGKLEVLKCLVKRGADIDSVSDKGSTPVRSACFMNNVDVVSYLIEMGADISRPNFNGGTCLINAIQCSKLCELLLKNGVDVNARDYQGKTALHYAINERKTHTVLLLLKYGADPHLKTNSGDDALQIACLKLAEGIFLYLLRMEHFPPSRIADAYELMGATFFDEMLDISRTLSFWREALSIRNNDPLNPLRKNLPSPKAAYQFAKEFETLEDLDRISLDIDAMKVQCSLIYERILGTSHRDMIFKLLIRGATYVDSFQFQKSIDFWRYALELKIQKDTLIGVDTHLSMVSLVKLFIDFQAKSASECRREFLNFDDVIDTTRYLTNEFEVSMKLLTIRPVFRHHQDSFDTCLKSLTHLLYVLDVIDKNPQQQQEMYQVVNKIVRLDPRDSFNNSLLHLAVSRSNKMDGYPISRTALIFPNARVIKLLLECGADVDAVNNDFCTPLHIASLKYNYNSIVRDTLISYGAHIDRANLAGLRPILQIQSIDKKFSPTNHITLKCLAARVIVSCKIRYEGVVPEELKNFLKIH